MRNTEPRDVNSILTDVMADLKMKQKRSNVNYYSPEIIRETAAGCSRTRQPLDLKTGDTVQIRSNGKHYIGRTGQIIGIKYAKFEKNRDGFLYTVRFSDYESAAYIADQLTFVRGSSDEK